MVSTSHSILSKFKLAVGGLVTVTGLFGAVNGGRLYNFHSNFNSLTDGHLHGRSLTDKVNITYMYTRGMNKELTRKLTQEHNAAFDKFKADGIWDSWFNTPRACWSLASDYFWLSSPVYRRYAEEGTRKHCVGYSCNISHDDVYRHPHGMNVEWKTNFQRGDAVHKYLLDHEVDYDDIYSYAKLERLLPGVEESLTCMSETINKSQMNEHHAADFRQLEDVKLYIEQIKQLEAARQADVASNTLSRDMLEREPLLYHMVRLFYGVKDPLPSQPVTDSKITATAQ